MGLLVRARPSFLSLSLVLLMWRPAPRKTANRKQPTPGRSRNWEEGIMDQQVAFAASRRCILIKM